MTPTVTRCVCCDLPVESCGKATETRQRAQAARDRARLLGRDGWVAANYPGVCSRCGERFTAGTPIHRDLVDGTPGWRCCE